MARRNRGSNRNRNGGYDLTAANSAHAAHRRPAANNGAEQSGRSAHRAASDHAAGAYSRQPRTGRPSGTNYSAHTGARQRTAYSNSSSDGGSYGSNASSTGSYGARMTNATHHHRDTAPLASSQRHSSSSSQHSSSNRHASHANSSRHGAGATGAHSIVNQHSTDDARAYSRSGAQNRYSSRKRGMSRGKKIALGVVAAVCVALVGCGVAAAMWYNSISGNLAGDNSITNTTGAVSGEPYYVLLLGGDSRVDKKSDNRTDSIMVARIDESTKSVTLISVPRDLRVKIGDHGYCKINSAIEYGGYDAVVSEVNTVLNIKINYYAFIYFDGFKDLVDALGGVTVKVPEGTYYQGLTVPAGDAVTINGKEALVLARCRHGNPPDQGAYAMGDYQRTLNQRNLIKAIANKVLKSDATKLPSLIEGLSKCIETNMSISQIVQIAQNMKGMDTDNIDTAQLPIAGATINGEWFAIMYKDVFEVMDDNFTNGRKLMYNLSGFDTENNDNDLSDDYTDGPLYSYTNYADHYGSFKGKSNSASSSTTSSSTSSSSSSTTTSSTSSGS